MSQKDFLSQFSETNKKPDSFKEEVRVKVQKEKKPINKFALIIVLTILLAIAILCYFLFLAPKIEMPNFVGKTKSDVAAFVKQQGIETSGIIFEEEYDFDNAEGVILTQSVEAGKKVKEDVKITFKASLGPDPDELIKVPDLESMDKTEIKEWIDDNKLTKTKITTSFSDAVEADQVISFAFSGCDEDTFTRNSTLKISISKGPAPAGSVTMEDFTKKSYEYVESWATSKKVKVSKVEAYSDTIDKNLIISQSIASGKTMKEGETFTVTVSLGKGIILPNFLAMSKSDVDSWLTTNKTYSVSITKSIYSDSENYIIEQSVKAGKKIGPDDEVKLTKNLGNGFYLSEEGVSLTGAYDRVKDWALAADEKGLDVETHKTYVNSDKEKGTILEYEIVSGSKKYSAIQKLPLEVTINCTVSNGEEYVPSYEEKTVGNYIGMNADAAIYQIMEDGFDCATGYGYNVAEKDTVYYQSLDVGDKYPEGSDIGIMISLGKRFKITDFFDEGSIIGNSYEGVYNLVNELGNEQFVFVAKPGDTDTVSRDAIVKDFKFMYNNDTWRSKNEEATITDTDLTKLEKGERIQVTLVLFSK